MHQNFQVTSNIYGPSEIDGSARSCLNASLQDRVKVLCLRSLQSSTVRFDVEISRSCYSKTHNLANRTNTISRKSGLQFNDYWLRDFFGNQRTRRMDKIGHKQALPLATSTSRYSAEITVTSKCKSPPVFPTLSNYRACRILRNSDVARI